MVATLCRASPIPLAACTVEGSGGRVPCCQASDCRTHVLEGRGAQCRPPALLPSVRSWRRRGSRTPSRRSTCSAMVTSPPNSWQRYGPRGHAPLAEGLREHRRAFCPPTALHMGSTGALGIVLFGPLFQSHGFVPSPRPSLLRSRRASSRSWRLGAGCSPSLPSSRRCWSGSTQTHLSCPSRGGGSIARPPSSCGWSGASSQTGSSGSVAAGRGEELGGGARRSGV